MDDDLLGISETIAALRTELTDAARRASDEDLQFEVGPIQLEFHVGVRREAKAKTGVRFWVLELGADGGYAKEQIQKVTVTLHARDDSGGTPRISKSDGERY